MLSPTFKFTMNIIVLKALRIPTILRKVSWIHLATKIFL